MAKRKRKKPATFLKRMPTHNQTARTHPRMTRNDCPVDTNTHPTPEIEREGVTKLNLYPGGHLLFSSGILLGFFQYPSGMQVEVQCDSSTPLRTLNRTLAPCWYPAVSFWYPAGMLHICCKQTKLTLCNLTWLWKGQWLDSLHSPIRPLGSEFPT